MFSKTFLVTVLSVASLSVAYAADIQGNTSTPIGSDYIEVGESNVWVPFVHATGKAGIATKGAFGTFFKVDLEGIAKNSSKTTVYQNNGATVYHNAKGSGTDSHAKVGTYDFVQVGNADVWFGEWSSTGQAGDWQNRQVFYVGDTIGTTMPTTGSATYSVKGINQFNGNNVLAGTFTADYKAGTLAGSIANDQLTVELKNVSFDVGNPHFSGKARAKGEKGSVNGRFYGAGAAGLAGLANFNNHKLNTSFGGTKN